MVHFGCGNVLYVRAHSTLITSGPWFTLVVAMFFIKAPLIGFCLLFASILTDYNPCNRWLYRRVIVYDGNFSNDHMRMRQPTLDVSLTDGQGYVVQSQLYQYHLKHSVEIKRVCMNADCEIAYQLSSSISRNQPAETTKPTIMWNPCHQIWMPQEVVCVPVEDMAAMCHIQWQIFRRVKGMSIFLSHQFIMSI